MDFPKDLKYSIYFSSIINHSNSVKNLTTITDNYEYTNEHYSGKLFTKTGFREL